MREPPRCRVDHNIDELTEFLICAIDAASELEDETLVSLILCRLEELRRRGCAGDDCVVLAGRVDIDLGQAVDLVEHGCPPKLALRILL